MRGIAILAVLFVHSYTVVTAVLPKDQAEAIARVADLGAFGVDLFFVLSGFLITGILLETKHARHYFQNFYARRFLRLLPVYYLYLLFAAIGLPVIHRALHSSIADYHGSWWWYFLYLCNWKPGHAASDPFLGHFWSLAIEEQFYIVWPAIVYFLTRRSLAIFSVAIALLSLALRCIGSLQGADWNTLYRLTIMRFDTLALGALCALAIRTYAVERSRVPSWILWSGLGGLALTGIYAGTFSWEAQPIQTIGAFSAAIGFSGLILRAATANSGILSRVLTTPLLMKFGKYSYALYVIHLAVIQHVEWVGAWLQKHSPPAILVVPLAMATALVANVGAFAIAAASWRYFERPILSYKDKFVN